MSDYSKPEPESPQPESFETGRSKGNTPRKKFRRVSQRRELAVVTLGAVAAITGLGGILATNPPDWAIAAETATPETVTSVEPATVEGDPGGPPRGDEGANPAPAQEWAKGSQPGAEQAPPAWSAPSREPAATESRGS